MSTKNVLALWFVILEKALEGELVVGSHATCPAADGQKLSLLETATSHPSQTNANLISRPSKRFARAAKAAVILSPTLITCLRRTQRDEVAYSIILCRYLHNDTAASQLHAHSTYVRHVRRVQIRYVMRFWGRGVRCIAIETAAATV